MRIGVCGLIAEDFEGKGQQRIAGENGGGLVKGLVRGGLATAEIIVIHGREIVMHQRVAMHAFERSTDPECLFPWHTEQGG